MKDRRTTWRMVPTGYEARVVDSDGKQASVRIADISERGAKLVLSSPENLTQEFTLLLSPDGFIQRRCRSAWRSGDQIGVEFTEITHDERLYSEVDHLKIALTR
ncbi:MAG: PilZ domain-containing protein [Xanthobacteraceae bacterium]|nr:PilZ domain-containing protein [Xanthobacteraceae bacterium]